MIWKFHAIFTRNVKIFFCAIIARFSCNFFFGNPSPHPTSHPVGQEGTLQQHLQLDQLHDQVNRRIQKHWHLWQKRQPDFRPRSSIRPILQDQNTTSQPRDYPEVSQCGWPPQNRPLSKTGPKHHEKPAHWQTMKFRNQCAANIRTTATFSFIAQFVNKLENYMSIPVLYNTDTTPASVGVKLQGLSQRMRAQRVPSPPLCLHAQQPDPHNHSVQARLST